MNRAELKEKARKSLQGHYKDAIIMFIVVALVSGLLVFVGATLDYVFKTGGVTQTYELFGTTTQTFIPGLFASIFSTLATLLFSFGILNFFLKLSRDKEATWKDAFGKMNMFFDFFVISLIVAVFTALWSLLLIIPGIIAAYAYSQVYFVKLDNPDMGYLEVIKKSKELMKGHKWEFFVLGLSFIGWMIVGALTLGILYFWLIPYMAVTEANFYNKLIKE